MDSLVYNIVKDIATGESALSLVLSVLTIVLVFYFSAKKIDHKKFDSIGKIQNDQIRLLMGQIEMLYTELSGARDMISSMQIMNEKTMEKINTYNEKILMLQLELDECHRNCTKLTNNDSE